MLNKLRLKFICITMVIVTMLLCAIFGLIMRFTNEGLIQNSISIMEMDGKGPAPPDKPGAPSRDRHFSIVQDPDGTLSVKGEPPARFADADYRFLWETAMAAKDKSGIIEDYDLRFSCGPDHRNPSVSFIDIAGELAAMDALWQSCCVIGLCVWVAMLVVSIFLANWAIRPVEQAWQQQRQFIADASHELKTPLTVIMTNAELLDSPDYADADKGQFIGSILTMSRQMRHLVEGLLELARMDNASGQPHFQRVDLSAVVSNAVLSFEALFFERNLEFSAKIHPDIFVSGSENQLHQIAEILLDNAQKYAAAGEVCLTLDSKGKYALLRLETPGKPLSKADQKNIFKRFYRVNKARSDAGSYGLGLSIAQQIVYTHNGKIWAEATDHSNIFWVQLPIA